MNMENEKTKLKPVIYIKGMGGYYSQNLFQQNLLLKALQVTADPYKLKELVGFKTVAEVYRTLDKLAIRREYHEALLRHGVDLDSIVTGIKNITQIAEDDAVKLKAYQILLKSLGLDEYKESGIEEKGGWEDIIKGAIEQEKNKKLNPIEYEVIEPVIPDRVKDRQEEEKKIGEGLYE